MQKHNGWDGIQTCVYGLLGPAVINRRSRRKATRNEVRPSRSSVKKEPTKKSYQLAIRRGNRSKYLIPIRRGQRRKDQMKIRRGQRSKNQTGVNTAYISTIFGIVMVLLITGIVSWFVLGLNNLKVSKIEEYEKKIYRRRSY